MDPALHLGPLPLAAGLLGLLLLDAAAVSGQVPDPGPEERDCTVIVEPLTDESRSVSVRTGPDEYVTHWSRGLRWNCGSAVMTADSAVQRDAEQLTEMIGSVDYRDSLRTLRSHRLDYHEREDRIVAEGEVRLRQLDTGTLLEAPTVEFFRAARGAAERTLATGRPRVTLPARAATDEGDEEEVEAEEAATVIDADRTEFAEDETGDEAWFWGDVEIRRPDLEAEADSARYRGRDETVELFGFPRVQGEEFTLDGRRILARFHEDELREVEADDDARARGDDFDLYAQRIRARTSGQRLERLWAFGEGGGVVASGAYRMAGDSLDFAFLDGRLDSLVAVGGASAVEVGDEEVDPRREIPLTVSEEGSWIAGDTLIVAFGPATTVNGESSGEGEALTSAAGDDRRQIESMRSAGRARAYYLLEPREGTEPGQPHARNYMMGDAITILFEDGEAVRVIGRNAVGVHLDPLPDGRRAPAPPPGVESDEEDRPLEGAEVPGGEEASEGDGGDDGGSDGRERGGSG